MEGGTLESAESTFPPLNRLHHSSSTELDNNALDEDTRIVVAANEIVGEEPAVLPSTQQTSERDAAPPSADSGMEGADPAINPGEVPGSGQPAGPALTDNTQPRRRCLRFPAECGLSTSEKHTWYMGLLKHHPQEPLSSMVEGMPSFTYVTNPLLLPTPHPKV